MGLVIRSGVNDSAMQILGSDNTGVIGKAIFYKGVYVSNIYISNNCFSSNNYAGFFGSLGQENDNKI